MGKEYNTKIVKWKENLFETYKAEVIDFNYESDASLKEIVKKYSDEERNLIYTPIVDSLKEKNKYNVSLTDKNFKSINKNLRPISKPTQEILTPRIKKELETKNKVLIQSYALSEDPEKFQKKDIFASYEMDYAELSSTISGVTFEKEYLVVRNPFQIKIVYKKPDFLIEDTMFEIVTRAETYDKVIESYNKSLINLYKNLFSRRNSDLSVDEIAIKDKLENTFTFSSGSEKP